MFTRLRTFTCQVINQPVVPPTLTSSLGDPYWDQVALLLHLEGSPGSTTFIDEKNAAITGASINYVTDFKVFGTSAVQFTPGGSLRTTFTQPQSFGKDFTIEFFIYFKGLGTNDYLFDFSYNGFVLRHDGNSWRIYDGRDINLYNNRPPLNTWLHVALQRRASDIQLFINGIKVGNYAEYGTTTLTSSTLTIGNYGAGGTYTPNCYMDEFRITNGVARYLDNFAVPTAPFLHGVEINTDYFWSQTKLCLKATNTTVTDASNTSNLVLDGITTNELAKVSGYSTYFNGASKITLTTPAMFSFGLSDFTIETWIYVTEYVSYAAIIDLGNSSISSRFCLYLASGRLQVTTDSNLTAATKLVPASYWTHVAVVRKDLVLTYYVNGNACGSINLPNDFTCSGARLGKSWADSYPFTGYLQDFRVTKLARYAGNFTPKTNSTIVTNSPSAADLLPAALQTLEFDPYWYSNTSLAMPLSSSISDLKGNPISTTTAALTSSQTKFAGSSLRLDGTQGYFTMAYVKNKFDWWTSDYTLECWLYLNSFANCSYPIAGGAIPVLIGNQTVGAGPSYWSFGPTTGQRLAFHYYYSAYGTDYSFIATTPLVLNQWHHLAMTKNTDGVRLFVDGVASQIYPLHHTYSSAISTPLTVGVGYGKYVNGYLQDLRITKGIARYLTNFTPTEQPNPTCGASF